jgi:predicted P-loop ATPase
MLKKNPQELHKFPVREGTKTPAVKGWQDYDGPCGTEPYGLPCGARNGFWVLDIDKKPNRDGFASLAERMADMPDTYCVRTPSGGCHIYFEWDPGRPVSNRQNVLPGVDVRGEGGYVLAGGNYRVVDAGGLLPAPDWLYDLVLREEAHEPANPAQAIDEKHPEWAWRLEQAKKFIATEPPCISGQGGEAQIRKMALRLMRTYEFSVEFNLDLLTDYNARCVPPWDVKDIERKLVWAAEKGTGPTGMLGPEWGSEPRSASPPKVPGVVELGPWRRTYDPAHEYSFDVATCGSRSGELAPCSQQDAVSSLVGPSAAPEWCGVWQYDEFAERIFAVNPPLKLDAEKNTGNATEHDLAVIRHWYAIAKNMNVSKDKIADAIGIAAKAASVHPVREYLDRLVRVEPSHKSAAVFDYFNGIAGRLWGALPEDDAIESELFKRQCVAACRRVRQPGVKSDDMLILYGEQDLAKSKFLRKLFSDAYFLDHLPDLRDKDAAAGLRGIWGVELAELTSWGRAGEETRKNFLSRQVDEYRGAYERSVIRRPRQCVFFGSTNNHAIFSDPTGNRRYNVVHVLKEIDLDAFDRDELWAAANALERAGYTHFFNRTEGFALAARRQEHETGDIWDDRVETYMADEKSKGARYVRPDGILDYLNIDVGKRTNVELGRLRAILRRKGCGSSKVFKEGSKCIRAYTIPDSIQAEARVAPGATLYAINGAGRTI